LTTLPPGGSKDNPPWNKTGSGKPIVWGVMKVLIVDDSEPMRRMIKTLICDLVGEIFECSDGGEALAAYQQHLPDLVLMDVKMSETDGLAATRQIKQLFPEARIVMVSQWEDAALRENARLAGAEAYVGKSDLQPLRRILTAT
jgi:two-component system chemotaxis response regulator CheY